MKYIIELTEADRLNKRASCPHTAYNMSSSNRANMIRNSHICILVLFAITYVKNDQTPRPHDPLSPLIYPEDYCTELKDDDQFDYIVIGAGPGGAPVARRLAEDPDTRVLLLEAGDDPIVSSEIPAERKLTLTNIWNIKSEPSSNQCLGYPKEMCPYIFSKFLGGTSVVNLMMYARGNYRDYNEWEAEGNPGWGWDSIRPYFLKLENFQDPRKQLSVDMKYHNVGGPFTTAPSPDDPQTIGLRRAFIKGLQRQNVKENNDPNGQSQIGYSNISMCLDGRGYRQNAAKAYLLDVPDNLKVCKYAVVNKLTITVKNDTKVVTGVEFTYNGTDDRVARAKKEYILSAGPISSPQILERSGVGRKYVLKKAGVDLIHELAGVGENLQEHFANTGCAFSLTLDTLAPRNPLSTAMTSLTIFLNMTDYTNEIPDLQWYFFPYSPNYMKFKLDITAQYISHLTTDRSYVLMAGSTLLRQTNRGYVHIKGTDPLKTPAFQPNQFTGEYEKSTIGKGCRLIRRVMNEAALMKFKPKPIVLKECADYKFNSDDEIFCHAKQVAFPAHHIAGTTMMGPKSNKMAVVDNNLRVHGIEKLRVVDLGVMPHIPRGNPEIPTIAISERAADLLKGKIKPQGSSPRQISQSTEKSPTGIFSNIKMPKWINSISNSFRNLFS